MTVRVSSRIAGFLKKPEIQFFLIFLVPFTAFFILNYVNLPPDQGIYVLLGSSSIVIILLFQTIYSIYLHAKLSEEEHTFLSVSAHQMRTPLTAVRWIMSEIGKNDNKPEERKDLARVADIAVVKLNNIIDAFSAIARIDQGQIAQNLVRLDMCDELEKAVEQAEPVSRQYGVAVHFDGPCEELWVKVDPINLEIVFSNLINNGVKYNHRGGVVSLGARRVNGGNQIEIMVRDTGMGIPVGEQGRIFERFFRGVEAQRVNQTGSGLGLHLTKRIIEQHGGNIWLESHPGKGTTFHFTLPAAN